MERFATMALLFGDNEAFENDPKLEVDKAASKNVQIIYLGFAVTLWRKVSESLREQKREETLWGMLKASNLKETDVLSAFLD